MKALGVVIVAGGSGTRMGADVPKQFLRIGGEAILAVTLRKFLPYASEVVVVLPSEQRERWAQIVKECHLEGTHKVCDGGATRFHSVKNGIEALGDCDLIAVHDGVRPLLSNEMIARGVECASTHGSAIPTVAAVDSFRVLREGRLEIIDRSLLRAVQTPQIFDSAMLREAYSVAFDERFTDDASVVEMMGATLHFYEGERGNIKITTPEDLDFAERAMKH
ncbi:MAG: 2-C-methyl-D-erythritol 4-phosphate cytidylyltransferase [Tidjanibacter sp.]|nr:2-C-methyl-D-erythritol 4-phosphate cytidylyltransferase [Tidjanibacter sp.]